MPTFDNETSEEIQQAALEAGYSQKRGVWCKKTAFQGDRRMECKKIKEELEN